MILSREGLLLKPFWRVASAVVTYTTHFSRDGDASASRTGMGIRPDPPTLDTTPSEANNLLRHLPKRSNLYGS